MVSIVVLELFKELFVVCTRHVLRALPVATNDVLARSAFPYTSLQHAKKPPSYYSRNFECSLFKQVNIKVFTFSAEYSPRISV